MIYRIGDNEVQKLDYNSLKTQNTGNESEKFNLNHGNENLPKEDDKKRDDENTGIGKKGPQVRTYDHGAIKVELSNQYSSSSGREKEEEDKPKGNLEKLLGFDVITLVNDIRTGIKEFIQKILDLVWNDSADEAPEAVEEADKEFFTDRESETDRESVTDMEAVTVHQKVSFVKQHSPLLTYYDRHGKYADITPSDKERILHGSRNTREL